MYGTSTSEAEVTQISQQGFCLLLRGEKLPLAFEQFPWLRQVSIEKLSDVHRPTPDHLYWPQLDVDLSVDSIRNPQAFSLVAKLAR